MIMPTNSGENFDVFLIPFTTPSTPARTRSMAVTMTWTQYRYGYCSVDGDEVKLSHQERELILRLLLTRPGDWVAVQDLVDWIWPDPDLQPMTAHISIDRLAYRLASKGINIEARRAFKSRRLACRSIAKSLDVMEGVLGAVPVVSSLPMRPDGRKAPINEDFEVLLPADQLPRAA
jgi:hypothetical protein